MTAALRTIEKITARVFCQLQGGGNPLTIFSVSNNEDARNGKGDDDEICRPLLKATQERLARTCQWESVMVHPRPQQRHLTSSGSAAATAGDFSSMSFYMPTGEQVSFCAHAAMGGSLTLAAPAPSSSPSSPSSSSFVVENERVSFRAIPVGEESTENHNDVYTSTLLPTDSATLNADDMIVSMEMTANFSIEKVEQPPTLHRILRGAFGLRSYALTQGQVAVPLPTFRNISVARPKTLVYVNSLPALHQAKVPPVGDAFRQACDALVSTGIYLYTEHPSSKEKQQENTLKTQSMFENLQTLEWECRQFPRSSGYAEDPATGIAAAALAITLYKMRAENAFVPEMVDDDDDEDAARAAMASANTTIIEPSGAYKFYQGTAMGHPSLIMVDDIKQLDDDRFFFRLLGRVQVDKRETIQVEDAP